MSYPLINGAAINDEAEGAGVTPGVDLVRATPPALAITLLPASALPMEAGTPRFKTGEDTVLFVGGSELARSGIDQIWYSAVQPSAGVLVDTSTNVLEAGSLHVELEPADLQDLSVAVLQCGQPSATITLLPGSAVVVECGAPGARAVLYPPSAAVWEAGGLVVWRSAMPQGVDLLRTAADMLDVGGALLLDASDDVLGAGTCGPVGVTWFDTQCRPMQAGLPSVSRGVLC